MIQECVNSDYAPWPANLSLPAFFFISLLQRRNATLSCRAVGTVSVRDLMRSFFMAYIVKEVESMSTHLFLKYCYGS